ncbi:MAG: hypothetical protein Q7U44_05790 [Desulfuromonadales bacterium]|nr:hypothetical protein [Desulfuromonadales bacterium]
MKRVVTLVVVSIVALGLNVGCSKKEEAAPAPAPAVAPAQPAAQQGLAGKVAETMNASGYTYVLVDSNGTKSWAAAPEFKVAVGDSVTLPASAMPMEKYESKSLNRTFDVVYFVDSVMVNGVGMAPTQPNVAPVEGHPQVAVQPAEKISGVAKADKTVAEVFAQKASLAGKSIKVRGKVVKFSPEIMGKNWIHLQDGSGSEGSNDLTVTTSGMAKKGDTIVVSGVVTADKDFGYGYKYPVLIEDAAITVE